VCRETGELRHDWTLYVNAVVTLLLALHPIMRCVGTMRPLSMSLCSHVLGVCDEEGFCQPFGALG
jgi:hypothetical protein